MGQMLYFPGEHPVFIREFPFQGTPGSRGIIILRFQCSGFRNGGVPSGSRNHEKHEGQEAEKAL